MLDAPDIVLYSNLCPHNPKDPTFKSLETFLESFQLSEFNEMQSKIT